MRDRRRKRAGFQAEKQQRYLQLIAQGVSNSEACRLVGINRKTGTRWRYGRSVRNSVGELLHYPPVKAKDENYDVHPPLNQKPAETQTKEEPKQEQKQEQKQEKKNEKEDKKKDDKN